MSVKGFNLLRPQVEPPTVWTKLYNYVVNTARVVVILVELVVVVAFVIRIVVDVQSKNLDEEIQTKEAVVKAFQSSEFNYRKIQNKTSAFESIWTSALTFSELYSEISRYIPTDIKEIGVQITDNSVFVSGSAIVSDIGLIEAAFKNSPNFIRQELDQVESEGSTTDVLGNFTLRADIREGKTRTIPTDLDTTVNTTPTPIEDLSPTGF